MQHNNYTTIVQPNPESSHCPSVIAHTEQCKRLNTYNPISNSTFLQFFHFAQYLSYNAIAITYAQSLHAPVFNHKFSSFLNPIFITVFTQPATGLYILRSTLILSSNLNLFQSESSLHIFYPQF